MNRVYADQAAAIAAVPEREHEAIGLFKAAGGDLNDVAFFETNYQSHDDGRFEAVSDEVLDRDRNRRALIYVPHTVMLYDKEGGATVVVLKEVTKGEEEQT